MMASRTHLACPTALVDAPVDVVWNLLADTAGWGRFYDLKILSVEPPGPVSTGQRLIGAPGTGLIPFRITFDFTHVDPSQHRLGFDGIFPFGIRVREDMTCARLDDTHCRINYNCDFTLPPGLRGQLLWAAFGRGFETGPAESLSRLKGEAESRFVASKSY
jgi:hypothetical protein